MKEREDTNNASQEKNLWSILIEDGGDN